MGEIVLHLMDNMELMKGTPDKFFDLAIVDPPYRDASANAPTKSMRAHGMKNWQDKPRDEYFSELFRVSKNQIVWGGNNFALPPTNGILFWYKRNPLENYSDGELAWTSFQKVAKCFDFPYFGSLNADSVKIHPTQKPVALYKWLLTNYAKPGDKILDTHLGSGSIAIACHDLGFDLTACEIDKDYYEAAVKRLKTHQSQTQLFLQQPKIETSEQQKLFLTN